MHDLEPRLAKLEEFVSPNFCSELAKRHRLVQRSTSQLDGHEFAKALMIPNAFLEAETLNSLATRMKKLNPRCNLSASALCQRINSPAAEAYMKACFSKIFKEILKKDFENPSDLQNLSIFNRVLVEDSTKIELHEKLSPDFKGSGGGASKSSAKIDYIFNYLSEEVVDVNVFSGNVPDQALAGRIIPLLEKNDLVLRDLGYYALERFKEIESQNAYYISRLKIDVRVYTTKEAKSPVDLPKFLDKCAIEGIVDVEVFIGIERHPVRLVACEMSDESLNKKNRAANKVSKKRGRKLSAKKLKLLKYCIFITNIPKKVTSSISIMAIYRIRWRIELIFKQWKSSLKLHIFRGFNKERFHCLLYGRLIMVLLIAAISGRLMKYALGLGRELSCYKLTNYLIADHSFATALAQGKMEEFIKNMLEDVPRRLCMDKRKRQSLRSNVRNGNYYVNELDFNGLNKKIS